jgi:hypothetical protein
MPEIEDRSADSSDEHFGLSEHCLAFVGQTLTVNRPGRPPLTGVVKKVRRVGHVTRDGVTYPGFDMLLCGRWRGAFPDLGRDDTEEDT